jgi:hypothetical protein
MSIKFVVVLIDKSKKTSAIEFWRGAVPEGKTPFEEPRQKWETNNRIDPRKIRWEYVDCINPTHDRNCCRAAVITAQIFRVP